MLRYALAFVLVGCCPKPPVVSPAPCHIPPEPERPAIEFRACGDDVCLSVPDAVTLARYQHLVNERDLALRACSQVTQ